MGYLIPLLAVAGVSWWGYVKFKPFLQRGEVRIAAAVASVLAFAGAAFSATREAWLKVFILAALGLWMAFAARAGRGGGMKSRAQAGQPSLEEARQILGVSANASKTEIQEAYMRLIRMAHPDSGGTTGLAAQLNAARDRLLKS
jgi:DnaJ-domain-containing protein 1